MRPKEQNYMPALSCALPAAASAFPVEHEVAHPRIAVLQRGQTRRQSPTQPTAAAPATPQRAEPAASAQQPYESALWQYSLGRAARSAAAPLCRSAPDARRPAIRMLLTPTL